MAGISAKAIKSKIKSMESTRQITKAMELVATSKLRGAQERAVSNRKYFATLYRAMTHIASSVPGFSTPFMQEGRGKPLYVVIGGDRGLAGGYNNNVFKLAESSVPEGSCIVPVGKKTQEYFRRHGWDILISDFVQTEAMSAGSCYSLARIICKDFLEGKVSRVSLIYTRIDSMLSQTPVQMDILPLSELKETTPSKTQMIYESGDDGLFAEIVPEYVGGVLYSAVKESFASEQAARRTAMDAASKNADGMIANLDLQYNRARQAAITQEITEIVAGSNN